MACFKLNLHATQCQNRIQKAYLQLPKKSKGALLKMLATLPVKEPMGNESETVRLAKAAYNACGNGFECRERRKEELQLAGANEAYAQPEVPLANAIEMGRKLRNCHSYCGAQREYTVGYVKGVVNQLESMYHAVLYLGLSSCRGTDCNGEVAEAKSEMLQALGELARSNRYAEAFPFVDKSISFAALSSVLMVDVTCLIVAALGIFYWKTFKGTILPPLILGGVFVINTLRIYMWQSTAFFENTLENALGSVMYLGRISTSISMFVSVVFVLVLLIFLFSWVDLTHSEIYPSKMRHYIWIVRGVFAVVGVAMLVMFIVPTVVAFVLRSQVTQHQTGVDFGVYSLVVATVSLLVALAIIFYTFLVMRVLKDDVEPLKARSLRWNLGLSIVILAIFCLIFGISVLKVADEDWDSQIIDWLVKVAVCEFLLSMALLGYVVNAWRTSYLLSRPQSKSSLNAEKEPLLVRGSVDLDSNVPLRYQNY